MKRALFAALAACVVAGSSGCCLIDRMFHCRPFCGPCGGGYCGAPYGDCGAGYAGCESCGGGGCSECGGYAGGSDGYGGYEAMAAGPPTGAVTYPYYTNRGPRDFLAANPSNIGR